MNIIRKPTNCPHPLPLYKGKGTGLHHSCKPVYKSFGYITFVAQLAPLIRPLNIILIHPLNIKQAGMRECKKTTLHLLPIFCRCRVVFLRSLTLAWRPERRPPSFRSRWCSWVSDSCLVSVLFIGSALLEMNFLETCSPPTNRVDCDHGCWLWFHEHLAIHICHSQ